LVIGISPVRNVERLMKSIVLAVIVATLAGCAIVPIGPPVYVGARVNYGGYWGHGYDGWRH